MQSTSINKKKETATDLWQHHNQGYGHPALIACQSQQLLPLLHYSRLYVLESAIKGNATFK